MAVVIKNSQPEESELICGVSNDCVVLRPPNIEPEPINFVSVNNGMYEATSTISELYNVQPAQPYQQLSNFQDYSSDCQGASCDELGSAQHDGGADYQLAGRAAPPTEPSEHSSSTLSVPVQDYYEIQVAEEEVVSDNWNVHHTEVVAEDLKPLPVTKTEDIEIPLPQDQDLYSQMHPYPCDFCSRRFSKKATLVNHMVSHQMERPHGCNLCGARYRRKFDLVNHMKIHAYPPSSNVLEDDDDLRSSVQSDITKGRRKKAQSLVPKRNFGEFSGLIHTKGEKKLTKNSLMKKAKGTPKSPSYIDEDMRLLSEMSRNSEIANQVPRWPVVDQSRPYVCQHCGVGFARAKALGSHSRIHGGDSPFECDMCGEMFWDVALLREHTRAKHPQLDAATAAAVASIYTGDDRFGTFHCDSCGASFHRLELLKKHRRRHLKPEHEVSDDGGVGHGEGEGADEHVCTKCGQFFENASELVTHAEAHLAEAARCRECGVRFASVAVLREHVREVHEPRDSPVMCPGCGKMCKDRHALAKHSCATHEGRSFPCVSCDKSFHSRARLRRHMTSHRDKAVTCSECGEECADGRALLSHRHGHAAAAGHPARTFPCLDCGKTFGSRSSQQIHVRIHTGERPYGCRFCWKAFADGGTLRKHERIHTGEKPYVCPVCPKAFNQRVVLREHIRAHHSGSDSKVNSYYECKVCGYMFGSSSELCLHLVQHSDENTAKQRAPSAGPRKYKRRRQPGAGGGPPSPAPVCSAPLGPSLPATSPPAGIDPESTDSGDSMIERTRKVIKKKYSYDSPPRRTVDRADGFRPYDCAVSGFDSAAEPKKQKLDKLMKKHKTKALSKMTKLARIEKRAKAAKLLNSSSYASKYVVSRPEDETGQRGKSAAYNAALDESLDTILNGSDAFRNRPRTKNVNYHNMKPTKLEPAVFPLAKSKNKKPRTKKNFVKKERTKTGSGHELNGSKRVADAIYDNPIVIEEKLETCIVDDFNIEGLQTEVKHEDIQIPHFDSVTVKSEVLSCEMCGDEFSDRSELLAHIRIHI